MTYASWLSQVAVVGLGPKISPPCLGAIVQIKIESELALNLKVPRHTAVHFRRLP